MSSEDQKLRSVRISEFVVEACDERTAPASEPVLRVSLIGGDLLSLAIEDYDEDRKKATFTPRESIVVDLEPFWNGLVASLLSAGKKTR